MSSLGWTCSRILVSASFALLAIWHGPDRQIHFHEPEIVATKAESAFDAELYHDLTHPYSSYECLPKHIHISQESNVNEMNQVNMTVSFTLDYHDCQEAVPSVSYGRAWHLPKEASAKPKHFNFTSSKTKEHFESDWIYHVSLPDLEADEKYWYRIAVQSEESHVSPARERNLKGAVIAETPEFVFHTPPIPGAPTTLALIGDLGQTANSTITMSHIYNGTQSTVDPVSLVLIVGDMSYADSEPERWNSWFELMEPLLRSTPIEVAAGNHEIECDLYTRDIFVQYENYFQNANRLGPAETEPVAQKYLEEELWNKSCSTPSRFIGTYNFGNAFYSFRHGLALIIVLSSYSHTEEGSVQYKWLEAELQKIDRSETPWVIVGFHCPLYTTFIAHNEEPQAMSMKKHMEPLFVQYGVNLIVSGHDHAYMRTHPLAFGEVQDGAPVYLTLGAGGNREQHVRGYLRPQPEEWVAKRDRFEYGYGNMYMPNATHACFDWVRDGTTTEGVQDHVWLRNAHV